MTYTGFKEDIVVESYTGQTEYSFALRTNGLTLSQQDDAYVLLDVEGSVRATLGDILVVTADERNNTLGNLEIQTLQEGAAYLLTVCLDADYLSDPATTYPIRIDPSINLNYANFGAGAIQDVTLNSLRGSSGSSTSLFVGLRDTYGISRFLMKFPGLDLSSIPSAESITSATVFVRGLMCEAEALTVNCHVFNGNVWAEDTANWSNVGVANVGVLLSTNSVSYANGTAQETAHYYPFNITIAVKGWKSGSYNQSKGILFKAPDSLENGTVKNSKLLASYDHGTHRPSLEINYIPAPPPSTIENAVALTKDQLTNVQISLSNEAKYFKYTPTVSGFYTLQSFERTSIMPRVGLIVSAETEITGDDGSAGSGNFRLTYHLTAGTTYYFCVESLTGATGSCKIKLTSTTNVGYFSSSAPTLLDQARLVTAASPYTYTCYKFTPAFTDEYLFFSANASGNPFIWIYDSNLQSVGENDNSGGNLNFRLTATLQKDKSYYIVLGHSGQATGSYEIRLLRTPTLPTEEYVIRNSVSGMYVNPASLTAQATIRQKDHTAAFDGFLTQWTIKLQPDGYYTIQPMNSTSLYMGVSGSQVGVDLVKLYGSLSDNTRWKIYAYSSGLLLFEPKNAPGRIISVSNNTDSQSLSLQWISNVSTNRSKWKFEVAPITTLEGQKMSNWCWVATALMMAEHYGSSSRTYTQGQVVRAVKGKALNETASIIETERAVNYSCYDSFSYSGERKAIYREKQYYEEAVLRKILRASEIVAQVIKSTNGQVGHIVPIVGYSIEYLEDQPVYLYTLFDPYPSIVTAETDWSRNGGTARYLTYDRLCSRQITEYGIDFTVEWMDSVVLDSLITAEVSSWESFSSPSVRSDFSQGTNTLQFFMKESKNAFTF